MAPVTSFSDASLSTAKVLTDTSPNCYVFKNVVGLARHVAQIIANVIREKNALGQNAVLALPAGSTPISVYRELVELHKRGELDFSRVITFNLDEYFGLPTSRPQSFNKWMHQQFFDHNNIPKENIHIPNGMVDIADAVAGFRVHPLTARPAAREGNRARRGTNKQLHDNSLSVERSPRRSRAIGRRTTHRSGFHSLRRAPHEYVLAMGALVPDGQESAQMGAWSFSNAGSSPACHWDDRSLARPAIVSRHLDAEAPSIRWHSAAAGRGEAP